MTFLDISPQLRDIRALHAQGQHQAARIVAEALTVLAPTIRCIACQGLGCWIVAPDPRSPTYVSGRCKECDGTGLACPICSSFGWVVQPWSTNDPHAEEIHCPGCWSTDEDGEYYPNRMKAIALIEKEVARGGRPDSPPVHAVYAQGSGRGLREDMREGGDAAGLAPDAPRTWQPHGLRRFDGQPIPFPGSGPRPDPEQGGGDAIVGG